MAPEQAGGLSDVDYRLDLYAMGVILYECLTGRLPFQADNYNRLIAMILMEPFPRPIELDPTIPAGLDAAILRAMARRREERFGSADEMIRGLVPFLSAGARARLDLSVSGGARSPAATAAILGLTRTCMKCGRNFDESFQFCPVDGARLTASETPPDPAARTEPAVPAAPLAAPQIPSGSAPTAIPPPALQPPLPAGALPRTTPDPYGAPLENARPGNVPMRGHSYFNTDPKELVGTYRMWVGQRLHGPWLAFRCVADAR